jgi:putative PIN family toxin of toxin-antitoxin system
MSSESRYVFDVNVIVNALLFNDSVPGQVFFRALDGSVVLISPRLVSELTEVLRRTKFGRYVTWEQRERLHLALVTDGVMVETFTRVHECRDPKDNQILELAVDGKATLVVTGDKDLLTLNPFRGIPVITPAKALELTSQGPEHQS